MYFFVAEKMALESEKKPRRLAVKIINVTAF